MGFEHELDRSISEVNGKVGIVVRDLANKAEIDVNDNEQFRAASIIKLQILWSFFLRCADGRLNPDERINITDKMIAGGFGVIRTLEPGVSLRLRDLAALMIVVSDNTATNILIDRMGLEAINSDIADLNLSKTVLQRRMCDYGNPNDNYTTPGDVAQTFESILASPKIGNEYRDEMLKILYGQQCRNKIRSVLPDDAKFAHKTGDLPGIEHDAGVLSIGGKSIVVVVLTQDLECNSQGEDLCRKVGRHVFSRYAD